jgi:hypothetical protein
MLTKEVKMHRSVLLTILVLLALLALPLAAGALGLDVEAMGGAGLALGTTDNPNATGEARAAGVGGINADLYLFSAGPVDIGLSTGIEYSYLTFHGIWNIPANVLFPGQPATTQTTDNAYSYLNIPIAIVGRVPLSDAVKLTFRAGGFIGRFLGGSSNINYSVVVPGVFDNGSVTLDPGNTEPWEYGLHFTGGADIALSGSVSLSPCILFDMGITDTSVNNTLSSYKDTFWSLTAMIGIKYKVF